MMRVIKFIFPKKAIKFVFSSLLYLIILFITSDVRSQTRFSSLRLDNSSGLSNSCINTIFEDSEHLIWFGTWDGLNVYDGSSFHVFNYGDGNNSIGNNVIYYLGEDKDRNIWIATIEGISRYDKKNGKFSHYFYSHDKNAKVVDKGFLLTIDANGNVFCTPKSSPYINYYDAKKDRFIKCIVPGFSNQKIIKIFSLNNELWILGNNGTLAAYTTVKNNLTSIKRYTNPGTITDFFSANNHLFFTTQNKELYHATKEGVFNKVSDLPYAVRAITYYKNKYILGWSTIGMVELDSSFTKSASLIKEVPSLSGVRITSLHTTGNNILWVGTDGSGILKVREKDNQFGLVKQLPDGNPINIPIRAFNEVDGNVWIGTKGNGIISIKNLGSPQSSYTSIRSFYSDFDILNNCVYAIEKGSDGFVYVGSDASGVTIYDTKKRTWINWGNVAGSKNYFPFKSVHSIHYDRDSSVWLGTESFGLIHLKLKRDKFGNPQVSYIYKYSYTGNSKGPGNNVIYTLADGGTNNLWVGCRYGGLSLFNKKTLKFTTFKAFSYANSLSNNDVLSLFKDAQGRLWIGTSYGLNYLSREEQAKSLPTFKKLTVKDGLPNNTIHGITQDNKGFIWASTNKGLVKINPETLKIVRFKEADGLQSNEFSDNAVWKNDEGVLFFGGIYGFNYFKPEKIKVNKAEPNLLLTELQLAGKAVDETSLKVFKPSNNFEAQHYTLNPSDNFFEVKVKAIDFESFEKCQYAYLLEGNDKVWHYQGENNHFSFSNIPPGNYTLKVKWSNGDGIWTNEVAALHIRIKQYFWLTWPAFLFYFLILSGAGYLFYRYRRNKIAMNHRLAMEHMLREKDEEVHQEQLNFFTNIAHELQTPLTLILGALERFFLKNKTDLNTGSNYFLSIVNQQASRLNYLVYQLLEFRKAEAGHLKNQYSFLNVSALLSNITQLFSQLNDHGKFQFIIEIEPEIELWIDKDKLEKIIFNLLSNAFKHTLAGHTINLSVRAKKESDQLEIEVSNSGCNLTEKELKSLFDRFFIVDDAMKSKISTGIGLAFTRELVTLLNGSIDVSMKDDHILFRVALPLSFVPSPELRLQENLEKPDKPSYLLQTVPIGEEQSGEQVIVQNNKKAMISSLEEQDKKTILIIEDEPSIRYLLNDILKDTYIVYQAGDGAEALEIVRKVIPNLIVSDIMMPDMSGLEVCNIIKTTPETCHIPFILLSARGTLEQKTEGYEAGADAYIPKPFQSEYLLVRIRKLLEYQQKLHALFKKEQFVKKLPEAGIKENDKEFLEQTVKLIEAHLDDESLDPAFLEDKLGMSKANFYRKMKVLCNMTPGELIKSIRLQQAASLLESSELTVSEIFYQTGFSNQSHFYREFKKRYDCSPVEYRSKHRLPVN